MRSVTITPAANQNGVATITLTVSDGAAMASDMFDVMVTAVNDPPALSAISNQTVNFGTMTIGPLAVMVSDVDDPTAAALTLSGMSSDQSVIANGGIAFGGSGASRTITLTLASGAVGTTLVTVTVSDNDLAQAMTSFNVTVIDGPAPPPLLKSEVIATGLVAPLGFVPDPTLPDTFYIVQQGGLVRTLQGGVLLPTPFADLTAQVDSLGERGLLGMAFSPVDSDRVFFSYTLNDGIGSNVVSRYRRSASPTPQIDPATRFDLLWSTGERFIRQPFGNHNGGDIAFGPDGYLYVSRGEGGDATHAQNSDSLLGKILRIDVDVPDSHPAGLEIPPDNPFLDGVPVTAPPEVWSFGWRNPWRFSFDNFGAGATGALIVADVGAATREEINYEPAGAGGRNYGWFNREGFIATPGVTAPPPAFAPLTDPLHDYDRSLGSVVMGGFVYRGAALHSSYQGRYFYADFGTSKVWSLGLSIDPVTGEATVLNVREHTSELGALGSPASFGRGLQGELYLATFSGHIRKIVPDAGQVTTPTISDIANQTISEDGTTGPLPFTIGDVNDPQGGWTLTRTSSNETLVPLSNIVFGGSGTMRTVSVTPVANLSGTARIGVTFESKLGESVTDLFVVTVTAVSDAPPAVSAIPNQTVDFGTMSIGPLALTVSDVDDPTAASLTLSGMSSNPSVVPNGGIAFGGSGANRTITLMLASGAVGATLITVTVSDGTAAVGSSFHVTVNEAPAPPPPPPAPAPAPPPPSPPPPPTPPSAPRNLAAEVPDGRMMVLAWDAPADALEHAEAGAAAAVTGYRIELGTTSGGTNAGTFMTGVTTSFTIGGLAPAQYFVRVLATSDAGASPPSNEIAVTLDGSGLSARAPRNLRVTVLGRGMRMEWDTPLQLGDLTGYVVEIGSGPGLANLAAMPATLPPLTVPDAPIGTYYVRVRTNRAAGAGPVSNEVIAIVRNSPVPCMTPGIPRSLVGAALGTILQLSWAPPASGGPPASYVIQAGSAAGTSDVGAFTVDGGVTSVGGPAPNGTFFLRVIALNACGIGAASNEVAVTIGGPPPLPPGAPGAVTVDVVGSRVTLSWTPPLTGGDPTRYIIEVLDTVGRVLATFDTGNAATTFTHANAPAGVYVVRVRGGNAGGTGPPSPTSTVVVHP